MPSIDVHALDANRTPPAPDPLPHFLQTPSGLAIVEIQGTIHIPTPDDPTSQATGDTVAGKLVFPNYSAQNPVEDQAWMKRVYMYIGKHQRLTGEVKKLPKPLGVLRKNNNNDTTDTQSGEQLEICEVVRYKIVFSQRPEPVGDE